MDTDELREEARDVVAARCAEDPWTERVGAWLDDPIVRDRTFMTARDIWVDALGGIDKQLRRTEVIRIAAVMRTLGWESTVMRLAQRTVRGYAKKATTKTNELEGLI